MKEVFISYKTEDFQKANTIRSLLMENGIECWMGDKDIHASKTYTEDITKAIQKCTVFVLVLSSLAQESTHVLSELECAVHHKKRVLPVIIENFRIEEKFEYHLRYRQKVKAYEDWKEAQQDILSTVQHLLAVPQREQNPSDNKYPSAVVDSNYSSHESLVRNDEKIVDVRYGKHRIPVKVSEDGKYQILCLHCEESFVSNEDYTRANTIWNELIVPVFSGILVILSIAIIASLTSFLELDLTKVSKFSLLTGGNPFFWGLCMSLLFVFAPKLGSWIDKKYVKVYTPKYTREICTQKLYCKKCKQTFAVKIPNKELNKFFYMDSENNQRHEIE